MAAIASYILGFLWMLGLPIGTPPKEVVSAIEHRLNGQQCVGPISAWHRHYQFQVRGKSINRGIVSIDYEKAGYKGLRAGSFVTEPELDGIDDNQRVTVLAEYDIATGKFLEWSCAWTFPWRSKDDSGCGHLKAP